MPALDQLESDPPPVPARRRQPPAWARSDIWLTASIGLAFAAVEVAWLAGIVLGLTLILR